MIVLTGAAGFIGSCMLSALNREGFEGKVWIVDDFSPASKSMNFTNKAVKGHIHRDDFLPWFEATKEDISWVIHLGARTDTTLMDTAVFQQLNLGYSKQMWDICTRKYIPLIYASSAATYGDGALGFSDSHNTTGSLHPLNPYGQSKHDMDLWALQQEKTPPFWMGCKFFNVYGPNEYHKGRMASVIFHTYQQIRQTGKMNLFRSHRPGIADGQQKRDFVYVMDVLEMILFAMKSPTVPSGLYNIGSGKARTFLDLATATFHAMDLQPDISFIDTPEDIRDSYQYFTEADMTKLLDSGYERNTTSLEDGVTDYIRNYLSKGMYY